MAKPNIFYSWGNNLKVKRNFDNIDKLEKYQNQHYTGICIRGAGNSYGDAAFSPNKGTVILSETKDKVIHFDKANGEITLEPAVNFRKIIESVLPFGFFPPVTPGTQYVTIAGAVASNVHGKNHHVDGSIEKYVLEIKVATPNGDVVCSKNKNRELFNCTLGGYGLTGAILYVKLKLLPITSSAIVQHTIKSKNLKESLSLLSKPNSEFYYSVAWIDINARGNKLGRGCIYLGKHSQTGEKNLRNPLTFPASFKKYFGKLKLPIFNNLSIPLFSQILYSISKNGLKKIHWLPYFYPLDSLLIWNQMYGKAGLIQYQLCLPSINAERGLEEILGKCQELGLKSFISILKQSGTDENFLPFCKTGYTLALDFPNKGAKTLRNLEQLDDIVIKYKGKVYLTKDSRLSPTTFRKMYPEYKDWMNTVKKFNPDKMYNSEMAERLKLWDL